MLQPAGRRPLASRRGGRPAGPSAVTPETVRVAAVQAAPVFLDRDCHRREGGSARRGGCERAAHELVAFPETWIPGYPAWIFGAAGWDDPGAKKAFRRLHANAVEVPSPATDALCRAARACRHRARRRDDRARRRGVAAGRSTTRSSTSRPRRAISRRPSQADAHPRRADRLGPRRRQHAPRLRHDRSVGSAVWPAGSTGCRWPASPCMRRASRSTSPPGRRSGDPELHRFASRHYAFEGRCFSICVMGASLRRRRFLPTSSCPRRWAPPDDFEAAAGAAARDGDFRARRLGRRRGARGRGDDRVRRSRSRPDRGGAAGARRRRPLQPSRRLRAPGRRDAAPAGRLAGDGDREAGCRPIARSAARGIKSWWRKLVTL